MKIKNAKEVINENVTLEMYISELKRQLSSIEDIIGSAKSYNVSDGVLNDLVEQKMALQSLLEIASNTLDSRIIDNESIKMADPSVKEEVIRKEISKAKKEAEDLDSRYQQEESVLLHVSLENHEYLKDNAKLPIYYKVSDASVFFEPIYSAHSLIKKIIFSSDPRKEAKEYFSDTVKEFDVLSARIMELSNISKALNDKSKIDELIEDFLKSAKMDVAFLCSDKNDDIYLESQIMRKKKTNFYKHLPTKVKNRLNDSEQFKRCFEELKKNYERVLNGEDLREKGPYGKGLPTPLLRGIAASLSEDRDKRLKDANELETILQDEDAINEYINLLLSSKGQKQNGLTLSSIRARLDLQREKINALKEKIAECDKKIEGYRSITSKIDKFNENRTSFYSDRRTLEARFYYNRALNGDGTLSFEGLKSILEREQKRLSQLVTISCYFPRILEVRKEIEGFGKPNLFNRSKYKVLVSNYFSLLSGLSESLRRMDLIRIDIADEKESSPLGEPDILELSNRPVNSFQNIDKDLFDEMRDYNLSFEDTLTKSNDFLRFHNKLLKEIFHFSKDRDIWKFDCSPADLNMAIINQGKIENVLSSLINKRENTISYYESDALRPYTTEFRLLLQDLFEDESEATLNRYAFNQACHKAYANLDEAINERNLVQSELDNLLVGALTYKESDDALNILDGIEDAHIQKETVNEAIRKLL